MIIRSSFQKCNFWKISFKAVIGVLMKMMLINFDPKLLTMTKGENKDQKRTITKVKIKNQNHHHHQKHTQTQKGQFAFLFVFPLIYE